MTDFCIGATLKKSLHFVAIKYSKLKGGKNFENFVANHSLRVRKQPGLAGTSVAVGCGRQPTVVPCGPLGDTGNAVSKGRKKVFPPFMLPFQTAGG